MVGRVRDRQEAIRVETVGEEVVDDPAVVPAQHAVLGAADAELRDVVGEDPLEEVQRAGPGRLDLTHMGHVEDARRAAYREVLLDHAGVLHRHLPAGEVDQASAGRAMGLEQGRAPRGVSGAA